jgi:UDP-N-acetylmuramoyl-L-alanyl-D-glutamate--2,6-diaminopimelate ligase
MRPKNLQILADAAGDLVVHIPDRVDAEITGLAYDSRRVQPGDLFFCVEGKAVDGHGFAATALAQGAAALCAQRPLELDAPQIIVSDSRRAMGRIAGAFFDNPADDLLMLGVTGTNGKTTTVFILESILRAAGWSTGLIGTIETRVAGGARAGVRTTPESLDLQRLFAEMRDAGVGAVAMEVTSHGLALHRVDGFRFSSVAFTNLSQDHLDFHSGMDDYFAAKSALFTPERAEKGSVNLDDEWGRRLYEASSIPCIGFGTAEGVAVRADRVRSGPGGSDFAMELPGGEKLAITTRLVGRFNVSNCLAAGAVALQAGIEPKAIERGINELDAVPGRFESVDCGQAFTVVVDYAHTPDSLDNVLRGARAIASGCVLCVFGCGGDRDRGKRPLMGAVAARLADVVVVTSDNPRSEDPQSIIDAIVEGVVAERPSGPDSVLVDRRAAITFALRTARPGDVVVIAGKGHETGQEFRDHTIDFDDREVARQELLKLDPVRARKTGGGK